MKQEQRLIYVNGFVKEYYFEKIYRDVMHSELTFDEENRLTYISDVEFPGETEKQSYSVLQKSILVNSKNCAFCLLDQDNPGWFLDKTYQLYALLWLNSIDERERATSVDVSLIKRKDIVMYLYGSFGFTNEYFEEVEKYMIDNNIREFYGSDMVYHGYKFSCFDVGGAHSVFLSLPKSKVEEMSLMFTNITKGYDE